MKIAARTVVRVGFGVAFLILIVIGILAYRSMRNLIEASNWVSHTHDVIDKLDELSVQMVNAESSARGYVLAGDDSYLEPYYDSTADVDRTIGAIQALTGDNPVQQRLIEALKAPLKQKLALHRAKIDAMKKDGPEMARQVFLTGRDSELMSQIQSIVGKMKDNENQLLRMRTDLANADAAKTGVTLLVGVFFSFVILGSVFYHLDRQVQRRAHSEARLVHLNRLYAVLSQTNQAIVRTRERDALFKEVCRVAVEYGALRMAWVGVVDAGTSFLEPVAWYGAENGYFNEVRVSVADEPAGRGPAGSALRQRKHFVCADVETDPRPLPWREAALKHGFRSAAAFPILLDGHIAGAFTLYSDEPGFFDDEIVSLLDEVNSDLSFALQSMEGEKQRQRAEQEVRRLNEDLERRIAERTAELAEVNDELEKRNAELARASRMKNEFLARMSHELRTPLNAVTGFSDLLTEGNLDEKQTRFVGHIQQGARHLLQLISDILDLSKIEAGRIELKREEFAVVEALNEVLSTIQPLATAKQMQIDNRLTTDLLVSADRVRFKQILYNLLTNAVKFTPEGGSVWLEGSTEHGLVTLSVCDTGLGIPFEEHERIFEEFHQAAATTNGVKEGTGLGLAITKRLVQEHGGKIWVESQPGNGSRFTFTLAAMRMERAAGISG
jgi:signal transduction histidine kinase/CHASE3 domain sensor protein